MSSPLPVPVALIGLGGVGKAILSQLLSPALSSKFSLILIANSRQSLSLPLPNSALTPNNYLPILQQHGAPLDIASVISVLSSHPNGNGILIDSTGSEAVPALYSQILSLGIHIVTPNKKAASSGLDLWNGITSASYPNGNALYYGESTVGAGLPLLSTLKDLVGTGDEIEKIEGVFSGTLSYIFNEYSKVEGGDVKFSEVVKVAKEKGYTVSVASLELIMRYSAHDRSPTRETTCPARTSPESSPSSRASCPPRRPCRTATPPSRPSRSSRPCWPTRRPRRTTSSAWQRATSSSRISGRRLSRRARSCDMLVLSTSRTARSRRSSASESLITCSTRPERPTSCCHVEKRALTAGTTLTTRSPPP